MKTPRPSAEGQGVVSTGDDLTQPETRIGGAGEPIILGWANSP